MGELQVLGIVRAAPSYRYEVVYRRTHQMWVSEFEVYRVAAKAAVGAVAVGEPRP
jgi:hypothetical protein